MASPHVAGAAALIMSLCVTEPGAVQDALQKGARVVDDSAAGKKLYGAGVLSAGNATERVTLHHVIARLLALLAITLVVAHSAKKKNASAVSPFSASRLDFWIPALLTGPGLLFFAPWVLPRVHLAVDMLARPLADMDLLAGVGVHRFLPLANALLPFGLTALAFGAKEARPAIAGFAAGTAAYLAATVALGEAAGPFGHAAMLLWCGVNAVLCAWIARTNLAETK
jgi:serine protease